jgi:hypothetical protein
MKKQDEWEPYVSDMRGTTGSVFTSYFRFHYVIIHIHVVCVPMMISDGYSSVLL